MKLESIRIENYRALKDVRFPLSQFVCITGQNNGGKSSALQALLLLYSGKTLAPSNYFDKAKAITITLETSGITDDDLNRLGEHKPRIQEILDDGRITLVRRYATDGTSKLFYLGQSPKDARFRTDEVSALVAGKKGAPLKEAVLAVFPELEDQAAALTGVGAAKDIIKQLGASLPEDQKEAQLLDIPTGQGGSIIPMLPERIYIPAVKDLADDTKTADASAFGKILGIVMDTIKPAFDTELGLFAGLSKKITRVLNEEGQVVDERVPQIRHIEKLIGDYVRESFSNVQLELEIPPPDIKNILSTAKIFVDDGDRGPLDLKGDGLRRAVVFSILRTYVEMSKDLPFDANSTAGKRSYLLLFEEPELFLHPDGQRILFDALGIFAKDHHVIVTTHSPLFLGPNATATFVRLVKQADQESPKPFTTALPVDLTALGPKDEFQLVCFENNNAAFFSKKVVLVEGDSDMIAFPHIAETLNPEWVCRERSIAFVRVSGKGSIARYRSFFHRFGVKVFVITDLDTIEEGFDKLDPTEESKALRSTLLAQADAIIKGIGQPAVPKSDEIKKVQGGQAIREVWVKVREAKAAFAADPSAFGELEEAVAAFFAWESKHARRECIRLAEQADVKASKRALLDELSKSGVFVLECGALDDYYPAGITGDKPSRALAFCDGLKTRDQVVPLSPTRSHPVTKESVSEFELICASIFD